MTFAKTSFIALSAAALFTLAGCSEGTDDGGMGGAGTGGGGTGGGDATGGTGGDDATGGTGGSDATGGSAGESSGGTGGGDTGPTMGWTFDSDLDSFALSWERIAGTEASSGFDSTAVHSSAEGDPDAGSIQLDADFSLANDQVFVSYYPGTDTPLDLTGKTVSARVKVKSGLTMDSMSCPGGAYLFVKSGEMYDVFARGAWFNIVPDDAWTTVTLNLAAPDDTVGGTINPADVVELGVALNAGGDGSCDGQWTTAQAFVDTVAY